MNKHNAKFAAYAAALVILTGLTGLAGCGGKTEDTPKNDPSYYTGTMPAKGAATTAPKGKTTD